MGEAKQRALMVRQEVVEALGLETAGVSSKCAGMVRHSPAPWGRWHFHRVSDGDGTVRELGQGVSAGLQESQRSSRRDILGRWLLSIVSGHWRYAHVSAVRCDGVNPGLLGMSGVVAEDTLRRALKAIDESAGSEWLKHHIGRTVLGLLDCPWILDVDVTIKPLYGKQQGAVVGYNPHQPGRPSHAYHSYQVSGLRLMLGVDVLAGNERM
jgi:hypothetical protein